jgi:hypothetical protein
MWLTGTVVGLTFTIGPCKYKITFIIIINYYYV